MGDTLTVNITINTWPYTGDTHRHHKGRERKCNSLIQLFTTLQHCVLVFFYLISCHGHILSPLHKTTTTTMKEMHPDRVTQPSTRMFIVIVFTHKCKFFCPLLSAADIISLLLMRAAKTQDYIFFVTTSKWSLTECFLIRNVIMSAFLSFYIDLDILLF